MRWMALSMRGETSPADRSFACGWANGWANARKAKSGTTWKKSYLAAQKRLK